MTRAALRALLLSLGVAGCALVSPSTGGNATACQLVPLAPEIATHVREALAAAHSGDGEAMKEAAQKARDIADRILAVTQSHEPGASPDPLLLSLLSVALVGDQAGFLFSEDVPSAEELESFEATLLGTLDLSIGQVKERAAACPSAARRTA